MFYVSGSVLIKASIVATLLRITTTTQVRYKIALWFLLTLSIVATLTASKCIRQRLAYARSYLCRSSLESRRNTNSGAVIAVLVRCKPISASWTGQGTCLDQSIIVTLTYVVSAVNILTDWSVAIMPAFILWNVQMKRKLKLMTGMILGLGVLYDCPHFLVYLVILQLTTTESRASTATIIRMPYSSAYTAKVNVLRKCQIPRWVHQNVLLISTR